MLEVNASVLTRHAIASNHPFQQAAHFGNCLANTKFQSREMKRPRPVLSRVASSNLNTFCRIGFGVKQCST